MALSKSTKIFILLVIDVLFFLLELVVGYAVHSLALISDSFHMLNDVLSLCVGLWAIKVAHQNTNSNMYTYGWQRAETLGALINGVFLVALCLSIFLEAIQRFVEPQEVSNPKLVLIVGCFGLASNLVGLFFFHDHGHSHGHGHGHGHSHGHSHKDNLAIQEEGEANAVPTQQAISAHGHGPNSNDGVLRATQADGKQARLEHTRSRSRGYSNLEDIYVHPASFRNEIIAAARSDQDSITDTDMEQAMDDEDQGPSERTSLLRQERDKNLPISPGRHNHGTENLDQELHKAHKHRHNKADGHKSSGHGDLNMHGVFLHVLGDALGNIGVIASALFIWLTNYDWRFYVDPLVSLVITVIILCSAIPLCKAASRILLQAVPVGMSVDDIKGDILELPGIISCHHLHVWQLSSSKLVASLHVEVDFDFKGEGSARYMHLARGIRECLHEYGIHSSTIQPEFRLGGSRSSATETNLAEEYGEDEEEDPSSADEASRRHQSKQASRAASVLDRADACLLECGDECDNGQQCCVPGKADTIKANNA